MAVVPGPDRGGEEISRWGVGALLTLFFIGVAVGEAVFAPDGDSTAPGAGVAVANAVHVAIGVLAVIGLVAAWQRDPARTRSALVAPFTRDGWRRLLGATFAIPLTVLELLRHSRRAIGDVLPALVATLAALVIWYSPLRAGVQVLAARDPDFTREAWGGPTYLGASLAHWMDGLLMFYAAALLLVWLQHRRRRRITRRP